MQIKQVIHYIDALSPLSYAEDFDNVGLLTGDKNWEIEGVLITLDTIEATVDEAIKKKCNLILSFHPIIFNGLKSITGKNYVERTIIKAIKNNIAIFAIHTALDNILMGVSGKMAEKLGLNNVKILIPKLGTIKKLTTYVPLNEVEKVRKALFESGAGNIGNYSHCSFNMNGIGTFLPNEHANPSIGKKGKLQIEPEVALVVYFEKHVEKEVIKTLFESHPYEEIAYEIKTLENIGMGVYGKLSTPISEIKFMELLKKTFNTSNIRHSALLNKPIEKIALLGGSGSFALKNAIELGADAFVSADFKYHDFYGAENRILITDIGHYESEQYTKKLLLDYIQKKFTSFAIVLSETITNPVFNYH